VGRTLVTGVRGGANPSIGPVLCSNGAVPHNGSVVGSTDHHLLAAHPRSWQ